MYCCSHSKTFFTSMCIMDILHFAVSNLQIQHPTCISCHDYEFFIFFLISGNITDYLHKWIFISTPIHNTLEYMGKVEKWSCTRKWRRDVQIQTDKTTTNLIKIISSNWYTGDVFLGSAYGQLLQNNRLVSNQTFRNYFVSENNGNILDCNPEYKISTN